MKLTDDDDTPKSENTDFENEPKDGILPKSTTLSSDSQNGTDASDTRKHGKTKILVRPKLKQDKSKGGKLNSNENIVFSYFKSTFFCRMKI